VSGLLFAYGAAGAVGLVLSGVFGDRFPRASVVVALAGVALSMGFLGAFGAASPVAVVVGLVAWSIAFGGIPALFQARILHSASLRIRDAASAWLTISFNTAIGGGALIGGLLLDSYGLAVLPWVGAALLAVATIFAAATDRAREAAHPQQHQVRPTQPAE
jgi:predicted MFS family arabinose efflux permease